MFSDYVWNPNSEVKDIIPLPWPIRLDFQVDRYLISFKNGQSSANNCVPCEYATCWSEDWSYNESILMIWATYATFCSSNFLWCQHRLHLLHMMTIAGIRLYFDRVIDLSYFSEFDF